MITPIKMSPAKMSRYSFSGRSTSGSAVRSVAPKIGPATLGVPPTTAKTRIWTARVKPKSPGSIEKLRCAERPPAHAASAAPTTNAARRDHGGAEGERERGREKRAQREAHREGNADAHPEQRRPVRSHRHERRVAERQLARVERDPDREREQRIDADDADRRLIDAE